MSEIAQGKQLLADLVEALANDPIRGYTNKELADACKVAPPYVTRGMKELAAIGWAEKDAATGRFRLTARLSRIATRVAVAFQAAQQSLADMQRNYTL